VIIPEQLAASCRKTPAGHAWLDSLPAMLKALTERWSLRSDVPFDQVSCSWVASVVRADGTSAVLKLGMPHMEGAHEIEGLRFWNGDPTVRLLEADDDLGAMLLERCEPRDMLRSESEWKQDEVIAGLLKRLWRRSVPPNELCRFRRLWEMLEAWRSETLAQIEQWPDAELVGEGLRVLEELAKPSPTDILLATDLHAGNVLRSDRQPWLVIDPKPFIGDVTYDLVQHLHNCELRLHADPMSMIKRLSSLYSAGCRHGNGITFRKGRDLSAWLGLVPRQHSTGGKTRLLGISKRGNEYLRRMFLHGARSVVAQIGRNPSALGQWLTNLSGRSHRNVTVVALANKMARTAWPFLSKGTSVRIALGASRSHILWVATHVAARSVLVGIAVGLASQFQRKRTLCDVLSLSQIFIQF
jgi:streptomycin 6-kinase